MFKIKKTVSVFLATSIMATSILAGMPMVSVSAADSEKTDEWGKVSAILDSYPGVYTKDTKRGSGWNTGYNPDGPLMGNGTVYAFMDPANQKTQNFYISHSNMWQDDYGSGRGQEYTTFGGVTIKPYAGIDLARNKTVTVSSKVNDNSDGDKLVNGKIDKNNKWCATGGAPYWAMVDLGTEMDIARWVVQHAQAGGETAEYNTKDFKLQYSINENPNGATESDWIDVDVVEGNTSAVTNRNLDKSVHTRYVRLLVTKPTQSSNTAVRICELELYVEPSSIQDDAQEFKYVQDMKTAEITAQSKNGFTTVNWLSAKENIMVTEITNITENNLPMEVSAWTANANTAASVDGTKMITTKAGISKPNETQAFADGTWQGWTVNLAMASQVIGDVDIAVKNIDDHKNSSTFVLAPGQKVTLVSAVEGGKQDDKNNSAEQAIEKATAKLDTRLTQDSLDSSKHNHRDYWKDYWMKSYIDIQDEKVERMYYGMLYMLGCASSISSENNGDTAAGLFPWTAAEHPAWRGDYTTNTDFQRQVHPLVNANRTDGLTNYLNIIKQFWPDAVRRSESVQDLNWVIQGTARPKFTEGIKGGALFPTHIGPWGAATERNYSWADYWNSPADATSVLMPVIKEWTYTLDEKLLDELYPLMKAVSVFWENYATFEDGKYVIYGATHEGQRGRNPIFDVDACKYMLENTILAANELGVDQDKVTIWQNILNNMSPVPTFVYNGKETICDVEGRTQSNPGYTFDGNPVTIQSVYYFDSIGMSASEAEKEKYINYINKGNGAGSHRRLISATRIGYDINKIMNQLIASINRGPSDWDGMRGNNTIGDIGRAANIAIIQDSMLQSNEGFLNIFANWYDNQETSFRRLGAENAFLVDADMNKYGQVTYANIHSEKGKDCSVLNPWQGQEMEVYENGELIEASISETNSLGNVYTFATKAGANYELKPKGGLPVIIRLDKDELTLPVGKTDKLTAKTNAITGITWVSDNNSVAVVGKDGTVTAVGKGTAKIKAAVSDTIFAECTVTVMETGKNVAPRGTATSNSYHENYTADRAINGTWITTYEGWSSANESWKNVPDRWLQIDLGEDYTIERWLLRHDGHRNKNTDDPVGDPNDASNWGDYHLQVSENGIDGWKTVDSKINNKNNTTDRTLAEPVTGRYFRIYMEFPMFQPEAGWQWSSGFARLNQVELYAVQEATESLSVESIETPAKISTVPGIAFEDLEFPKHASVKLSNGEFANLPVQWQKGDYNEKKVGIYTLTGTLVLPEGITNSESKTASIQVDVAEISYKADLEALVSYAKAQRDLPEYRFVVPAVKSALDARILSAEAIIADVNATQANVDLAYSSLLDVVQMLSYTGDNTTLLEKYNVWKEFNPAMYTPESAKAMTDALAIVKPVIENPNALQDEIDTALAKLETAIEGMELYTANKDALRAQIEKANKYNDNLANYIDNAGKTEFIAALAAANEVVAQDYPTQEAIDAACTRLMKATWGLREIPNKDKLQEIINQANALDVTGYTASSVKARIEAISYAQTVMADPMATQEDVNAAITGIKTTTANLVLVVDEKTDDKETTDKETTDTTKDETTDKTEDTKVPTTSDTTPLAVVFAVAMAGCACIVVRKKVTK